MEERHTKLSRSTRILETVKNITSRQLSESPQGIIGTDAESIASILKLNRANVSKLLNVLLRFGDVIKIIGRPTLYVHRGELVGHFPGSFFPSTVPRGKTLSDFLGDREQSVNSSRAPTTALEQEIGCDGSMAPMIRQAKAAVSYPQRGLHTLLAGSLGIGKSRFAEEMYDYAMATGAFPSDTKLVVFDCQDYSSSSAQHIMAQLFGIAKGALPGDEKGKRGLIETTKGILYLNNIQRLPPRAMDMLIVFLEKNIYSRLGEPTVLRHADVMIICATTELPGSPLIERLCERIPVVIRLPSISERGTYEILEYLFLFFGREAAAMQLPIRLRRDVLACLAAMPYHGNIAEMKNLVRIVCSQAYLDYMAQPIRGKMVGITERHLPPEVLQTVSGDSPRTAEVTAIFSGLDGNDVLLMPGETKAVPKPAEKQEMNDLSEDSNDTGEEVVEVGNVDSYIGRCISRLRSSADAKLLHPEKLLPPPVFEAVGSVLSNGDYKYMMQNQSLLYGFLLHLRNVLSRLSNHVPIRYTGATDVGRTNPKEYEAAFQFRTGIQQATGLLIPEQELGFIAMYLYLASRWSESSRVGLLAVCHGESTAESMAKYVNSICGCSRVAWINFSSGMTYEELLQTVLKKSDELNRGLGMLFLTDIEPLLSLHQYLTRSTGVPADTLANISLPLMLSVARKSMESGCTLQALCTAFSREQPKTGDSSVCSEPDFMDRIIHDVLSQSLTFLNPEKSARSLLSSLNAILKSLGLCYSDEIAIKFIFHCSHMLERAIRNESLKYVKLNAFLDAHTQLVYLLEKELTETEEIFGVKIPPSELAYVAEIFLPYLDEPVDLQKGVLSSP
jgi:transcriptional regulator with AAA-type ATPase domain/transcriptional regulatory protein LevR